MSNHNIWQRVLNIHMQMRVNFNSAYRVCRLSCYAACLWINTYRKTYSPPGASHGHASVCLISKMTTVITLNIFKR